jgi:predicted nucleotidyltransferase
MVMKQYKLLKEFEKKLVNFSEVLAVYYAGSTARKSIDKYSDLDLYLVVSSKNYDSFKMKFKQIAELFGEKINFMFSKDAAIVYLGKEFIKVEINLIKQEDLKVSSDLGLIRILFDKEGSLKNLHHKSKEVKKQLRDVKSAERFFTAVRDHYISIARHYARGQKFSAVYRLQTIKSKMIPFIAEIKGVEDFEVIKSAEKILTKEQYALMKKIDCNTNKKNFMIGLNSYFNLSNNLQKEYEKKIGEKLKINCNDKEVISLVRDLQKRW